MDLPNSPAIQQGVQAGGGHGKAVETEEGEEVEGPAVEWDPHVFHKVEDVNW